MNKSTLMEEYLPQARAYFGAQVRVEPLAQGEYNLNYLVTGQGPPLVFRVNIGTQIGREDQIEYEYKTLELLAASGVTPRPIFVDGTKERIGRGVLGMEYLDGVVLSYQKDIEKAAKVLARVHQVRVEEEKNHLIREQAPLSLIYEECVKLLEKYFNFQPVDVNIRAYLKDLLAWAQEARQGEKHLQADPWLCIVNTEVNSGNFIINPKSGAGWLVDWEMARWGDPSQDVAHFCSPLTTLWKTDYQMDEAKKKFFVNSYLSYISDAHLRDTFAERLALREPFVRLRGIAWSAMAWAAYQTGFEGVRNEDTWRKVLKYMDYKFIRSIFDPYLA